MYLMDTNVLLRWSDADNPRHSECVGAVNRLIEKGFQVCVCAQILIEYWVTATRPREVNGFGISVSTAEQNLSETCRVFPCLSEPPDMAIRWRRLVVGHNVIGKQAHDARIAAVMIAHDVEHLLTINPGDFTRYQDITPLTPSDVLAR
ncbi:MAG: PIN domain-containing protein [Armatimonadota bacterium]|nr:PIN domain-containing protein [Armatimonadota bacterium]